MGERACIICTWRAEVGIQCLLNCSPPYRLYWVSHVNPELSGSPRQVSQPIQASPCLGIADFMPQPPGIYPGAWDPNSDPHPLLEAHSQKFLVIISSDFPLPLYFAPGISNTSLCQPQTPPQASCRNSIAFSITCHSLLQCGYFLLTTLPVYWSFHPYPVCNQTRVLLPASGIAVVIVREPILVLHGSLISVQSLHLPVKSPA